MMRPMEVRRTGPQDEEDMSDEFGDDYGYDDPEEC